MKMIVAPESDRLSFGRSTYAGAGVSHAYVTHDKWAGRPAADLTYPNGR